MNMEHLQNIQSFETSEETGNLQSYDEQSILTAGKVTLRRVPPHPGANGLSIPCGLLFLLRAFIGMETAALTFRTKQYSTSYSSHICYGKRFYNDFFLNHHTIALVNNCLKLLSCVVIETALDLMKKNQLENLPF